MPFPRGLPADARRVSVPGAGTGPAQARPQTRPQPAPRPGPHRARPAPRSLVRSAATSAARVAREVDADVPSDSEVVPTTRPLALPSPAASDRFKDLRVLVVGATGETGRRVVEQLAAAQIPVRALVRDTSKAAGKLPSQARGVTTVEGDVYQYATLPPALGDCNAVVIASGARPSLLDPLGPFKVDFQGVQNVVAAAKQAGVRKVVLVSSVGVDDVFFPLNLAFGDSALLAKRTSAVVVLFWKKRGEEALQRSGLDYTIVRPGGLLNAPREGSPPGEVVLKGPDTFGLPPRQLPGSILRSQVAEICIESLVLPEARYRVVEAIAEAQQPRRPFQELFRSA